MPTIDRILCPTDFSSSSARAYDYALSLARHYHSKLFLQHVLDFTLPSYAYYADAKYIDDLFQRVRHDGRLQLEEFAKRPSACGAEPERVFCEGRPVKSILAFAQAKMMNLIVMGTHGQNGNDRAALLSVTEKVLRHSPCSVLVVHQPEHDFAKPESEQDPIRISRLLVCTDFSAYSTNALEHAISIASEYNAELTVLHVLESLPNSRGLDQVSPKRVEDSIPPDLRGHCTIKCVVRTGKPYREIIQQATEAQSDAVIMGVRGRNALDLAIFGSTTHRVIQSGPCPVLAVQV
jgi:nucleotide-binding universal stress UspA family protein